MDPVSELQNEAATRAERSKGISEDAIYRSIEAQIAARSLPSSPTLIDVGCGRGHLWARMKPYFSKCTGIDLVRHPELPDEIDLITYNLDQPNYPLPDASADVVIACEVTPQMENPHVLFRECTRICKPGGWIVVHNPNNVSLLSIFILIIRQRFVFFQDSAVGLMLTPLLPCDLVRMSQANRLEDIQIFYTESGRAPFNLFHYPKWLSKLSPRLFSDNVGVIARKPETK